MKTKIITHSALFLLALSLIGCGSVPPEFITSMEKERDGINLLKKRHEQAVYELVENWYNERLARLIYIKQIEISKITLKVSDPDGSGEVEVIRKEQLLKIDRQFSEGVSLANNIRNQLIDGYSDSENWDKLVKLHSVNLEMTRSLTELNKAQRAFYSELVGNNVPTPDEFIKEKTKNLLNQ